MTTFYTYTNSPVQPLLLTSNGAELTGIYMGEHKHGPSVGTDWIRNDDALPFAETKRQLDAYFTGTLQEFALPSAQEGTEFQQRVWEELKRIPYGETISYGELAKRIGAPNGSRAVGLANGRNPLSIVVPCHRVIGANGKLTGYGGGIERKEALLAFEKAVVRCGPHAMGDNGKQ